MKKCDHVIGYHRFWECEFKLSEIYKVKEEDSLDMCRLFDYCPDCGVYIKEYIK